jgi:predicted ATPase
VTPGGPRGSGRPRPPLPESAETKRPSAVVRARARKTNLRAPLGAFVGRDADLGRVLSAIEAGARLVTVTGPPGIGKTRLAQRCLELASSSFEREGGAWFCDLSAASDARALAHAVARVLPSLEGAAGDDDEADVGDALAAAGPTLLVLDNFEQLVAHAGVVASWCEAAPELTVLVTSRERLAQGGEVVVELGPLACPREDAPPEEVLACDAVKLLSARAAAIGGELGADPEVLGALVRRLDGIPLAIELAAARTRVLGARELASRLAQRFDLLARRPLRAEDRHATLASAIEWSWNLLSPAEQRAIEACSVFAGDFTLAAAEAVLDTDDAVDLVAALRDKSLLHGAEDGRLALYLSIRSFAAARLAERGADEVDAVRLRHARWYAAKACAFGESRTFQGGPDAAMREELGRDRANLLAALAFAREPMRAPELVAELALGLTLLQAAPAEACIDALGASLDALLARHDRRDATLIARIRLSRQGLLRAVGRMDECRADLAAVLAMDDVPQALRTLARVMEGIQLRYRGLARDAWESHLLAEKELDAAAPPRLRAMNLACMGRLGHELRDPETSRRYNERARAVAAEIGDAWLEGLPLANVAQLEQELGRFDEAARLLREALARFERTNEQHYVAVYSMASGDLAFERGEADEARTHYAAAARFFTGWLAHREAVLLHGAWAALEARYGAIDEAETRLERARRSAERSGAPLFAFVLEAHGAQLDLRRAKSDPSRLADVRARLAARHAELAASGVAATSFDARFALRMLAQSLSASGDAKEPAAARRVVVAADGSWFVAGDKRVDLGRRGSLRRILAALLSAKTCSRDELLANGWPGERLLHDAASKRLRVAVATLRSLGLRDAILTRDEGYALDPRAFEVAARDDV